ncbi:MAG: hypothetical protein KC680_00265 [Candidatus Peregrinibacteria bacterium]|nr:hypothetical protein [Candidatus Peregrinibacteria bacterium]MCB9807938.1 hypothetical protein [Candidatus Peribacteria bacterium]
MDAKLKTDQGRAIVEGKTAVPFKTFVGLVLQRKVLSLFKDWGKEPVIIDSELLTDLASAPQDNQENVDHIILVTLGVGVMFGVFVMATLQIALAPFGIGLSSSHLLAIAGTIFGLALITWLLSNVRKKSKGHRLTDTMEKIANMVGK